MSAKKPKKKAATKKRVAGKARIPKPTHASPPPSPLPLDKFLAGLLSLDVEPEDFEHSPLDEAQELMYDAWEAPTQAKALALARQALMLSPDCADAYSFIANATAKTHPEAIALYKEAVAAGERALGPEPFVEDVGHFWGLLETRPYMRARANLAETLRKMGRLNEAVAHYQDLLRLNPGDNQGLRYILINCLLELGLDGEAENLIECYDEDGMAFWNYSRALLAFRQHGATPATARVLKRALRQNLHVADFLAGRKRLPKAMPAVYSPGAESEAILYSDDAIQAWQLTPGAIAWLRGQI